MSKERLHLNYINKNGNNLSNTNSFRPISAAIKRPETFSGKRILKIKSEKK
jgi:hypothetical protein